MTLLNRLKLALGLALVIVLVGALATTLNTRLGTVRGISASLVAEHYPVGTDYSGLLTKEYVAVGDVVETGDPMFEIQSNGLGRDVANGLLAPKDSPFDIKDGHTMVLTAPRSGTVHEVRYQEGAFVPGNTVLSTVVDSGSLYVDAQFRLTPADYAQIRTDSVLTVTLPDDSTVNAEVVDISVETVDAAAVTQVRARPSGLDGRLFAVGTPVMATMRLRDDGLLTAVTNLVTGLLTPRSP